MIFGRGVVTVLQLSVDLVNTHTVPCKINRVIVHPSGARVTGTGTNHVVANTKTPKWSHNTSTRGVNENIKLKTKHKCMQ